MLVGIHYLLSISQLYDKSSDISFKSSHCIVAGSNDNEIKFIGKRHDNVYLIDLDDLSKDNIKYLVAMNVKVNKASWIWRIRLGYRNMNSIASLSKMI